MITTIRKSIPLIAAAIMIAVAAFNTSNVSGYTLAFFIAIIAGAITAENRKEYAEAVMTGLSDNMFGTVSVAIILASVAGSLVSKSGMIESLSSLLLKLDVSASLFTAMSFVLCCVLSMSTGTSVGTYVITVPVFFPVGVQMGTDPVIMIGAIASGGLFGDNLAPISDTTIASSSTQYADMAEVVRTRSRYSVPIALLCFIIFLFLGNGSEPVVIMDTEFEFFPILMLLVPFTVIILCLKRSNLITSLSAGIIVGVAIGLICGIFKPSDLIRYPGNFNVEGIIIEAIEGSASTVFMLIGAFMFLGILNATDVINRIAEGMAFAAKGRRSAEFAIMVAIGLGGMLTGVCTVSMIALGPVVHAIGESYNIKNTRCANLMDCGGLSLTALAPWTVHAILPASLAMIAMPEIEISPLDVVLHNLYPLLMTALILLSIISGWGSEKRTEVE